MKHMCGMCLCFRTEGRKSFGSLRRVTELWIHNIETIPSAKRKWTFWCYEDAQKTRTWWAIQKCHQSSTRCNHCRWSQNPKHSLWRAKRLLQRVCNSYPTKFEKVRQASLNLEENKLSFFQFITTIYFILLQPFLLSLDFLKVLVKVDLEKSSRENGVNNPLLQKRLTIHPSSLN